MRSVYFLSIFLLLTTCFPAKQSRNSKIDVDVEMSEKIVFLVFRISRTTYESPCKIELVSQAKSAGVLKKNGNIDPQFEDFLTVEVYENNQLTYVHKMEHPLSKHVEYLNEGDQMESKKIQLLSEEFFVRLQIKSSSARVKILETIKGKSTNEIFTYSIK